MTEAQWVILLLKIGSVAAIVSVAQWIACYTVFQPWWRSRIGRSLILLAGMSMVTPVLFILTLFFNLNRADSHILAWTEIALLFAYVPAMLWRSWIWTRVSVREEHGTLPCGKKD